MNYDVQDALRQHAEQTLFYWYAFTSSVRLKKYIHHFGIVYPIQSMFHINATLCEY